MTVSAEWDALFKTVDPSVSEDEPIEWPLSEKSLNDRFAQIDRLSSGGFGTVYSARDRLLGTDVAIKISRKTRDKLTTDVKRLRNLPYSHYIQPFDYGIGDKIAFFSSELLVEEGGWYPLSKFKSVMNRFGVGPVQSTLHGLFILKDLCLGLDWLHDDPQTASRHFHGDVKLQNVFFNKKRIDDWCKDQPSDVGSCIKIIDLGLSQPIGDRPVGYTEGYAPDEQVEGRSCTDAADSYAVGQTIVSMFSGRLLNRQQIGVKSKIKSVLKNYIDSSYFLDIISDYACQLTKTNPSARVKCWDVFDEIDDFFGLILKHEGWAAIESMEYEAANSTSNGVSLQGIREKIGQHIMATDGLKRHGPNVRSRADAIIQSLKSRGIIESVGYGKLDFC